MSSLEQKVSELYGIAIEYHKEGRLLDAEQTYRQVLEYFPEHVDALHLLGIVSYLTGKPQVGISLIENAIRLRPSSSVFYNNLGNAFQILGRFEQAISSYQQALEFNQNYPEAYNNLGNVFQILGNLERSIELYERALEINQNYPEAHNNLGNALQILGKLEEATLLYERALELNPNYPEAYNNLGNALQNSGKLHEAVACYQRALELNPNYPEAYNNLGTIFQFSGKLEDAITSYQRALELYPQYLDPQKKLGDVFLELEKFDEAISCYGKVLAVNPEDLRTANNLGIAFLSKDLYEQAQEIFNRLLFKKRGVSDMMKACFDPSSYVENETDNEQLYASPFKLQDRIDQLNYLIDKKKIDASFQDLVKRYDSLLKELNSDVNRVPYTPLTSEQKALFVGYYDKIIYYADAPQISGSVLNDSLNWNFFEDKYISSPIVCFDDFLTPTALEGLQKFCLESTVFFRDSEAGFVGSYMAEGFSCSLIYQIISELKLKLPRVLNGLSLNNMWVYRYGSRGSGVKTHTGDGSVTLNFWLTTDEANLNQNGGSGLVIYDKEQPIDWDWLEYNIYKDDPEIQARISKFLESANSLVIPYRCNRAILFHSNLFHRSDPFYFQDSFENRRMNITMLFGRRGKESVALK